MRIRLKRWLFLAHRWLGVVACAFFAMWFLSGVVMMYVGYPKLTEAERLAHLPALGAGAGLLSPRQALDAAGMSGPLKSLRLAAASGGQPVYLVVPASPRGAASANSGSARPSTVVLDARTGAPLRGMNETRALASAAAYARPHGAAGGATAPRYAGTIGEDAFTHSRALDMHRPLHVVELADPAGTRLYLSDLTGEVVRDATRTERIWNFAGAWIHWLYPLRGTLFDRYWASIVNWLSIGGIAVALTGTAVGVIRWRFSAPYRKGSRSPYASGMMRWHHVVGLLFAAVTIAWIFSGLMSMNPWKLFNSGAAPVRAEALQGGALEPAWQDAAPQALLAAAGSDTRELAWTRSLGSTIVQVHAAAGPARVLDARTAQPHIVDAAALRVAAAGLVAAPLTRIEPLNRYDLYYYARAPHTMTGGAGKPLPAWRLVYGDRHATWVHLDPATGAVINSIDSHRRASRWLFAMLHSWDWLPLLDRRPLWDLLLLLGSAGGMVLSVTGIVIGWRRLKIKAGHRPGQAANSKARRPEGRTSAVGETGAGRKKQPF